MRYLLAIFLLNIWTLQAAPTYCDAPPQVAAALREIEDLKAQPLSRPVVQRHVRERFEQLLQQYPNDLLIQRGYQRDAGLPRPELIAKFKQRYDANPDDALATYLYALSFSGENTDEASRLMEDALRKDPSMAWPHLAIAYNASTKRPPDHETNQRHLEAFVNLCPATFEFSPNLAILNVGSAEVQGKVAAALRKKLAAEQDMVRWRAYIDLWSLEFKLTPFTEHEALRKRVAADVARIRTAVPQPDLQLLEFLREGHRKSGDKLGEQKIIAEIEARFPNSNSALRIVTDRWREANPFASTPAYFQAMHTATAEFVRRWPQSMSVHMMRFPAALEVLDLPVAILREDVEKAMAVFQSDPDLAAGYPYGLMAAGAYLKRGIEIERIPDIVRSFMRTAREANIARQKSRSDRATPQMRAMAQRSVFRQEVEAIELQARAYRLLKNSEPAAALNAELDALVALDPEDMALRYRAAGHVAALGGRKLDAITYWDKWIAAIPLPVPSHLTESVVSVQKEMQALWTDLGGTAASWNLRDRNIQVASPTAWKPAVDKIPTLKLLDTRGRQWNGEELLGKTVLINLWASWCGPCRAEHPELQKLYEKLKDRPDIALVTLNLDMDLSAVQPYLDDNKYTFPVLVNGRYRDIAIPTNYILDSKGIPRWQSTGYDNTPGWVDRTMAILEKTK